ncbi:MAG: HEAT repeat domain-containing protein [Acidobacteria bacterium]|nr:HEAT repeat domain-containing protein [Acidobacteriota bacterium]
MTESTVPRTEPGAAPEEDEKSDLRVVLQFFIVPMALVIVLVAVFFGLQMARSARPDPGATLESLRSYEGFLAHWVGDLKRWQSGYDLSLLLRADDGKEAGRLVPDLSRAFREAGGSGDLKLRRYLALALGRARDARAAEALREGMKDADVQTRLYCAWGLLSLGDRSALGELRAAVADADPAVRKVAAFALGHLEDRDAVAVLLGALRDPEEDVRWNAALSLARLGRQEAAPVLIDLLDQAAPQAGGAPGGERSDQAINAIRGLALLKDAGARERLNRVASGAADPRVREAARLALTAYASE